MWFAIIKLVSSANKIGLDLSDTLLERSLIYIKNNNGQRMEPCGTPCCTSFHLERQSFELLSNKIFNKLPPSISGLKNDKTIFKSSLREYHLTHVFYSMEEFLSND